jgi:hypothetical protein
LKATLDRGLRETAGLWPTAEGGFAVVHRAAEILDNAEGTSAAAVRTRYRAQLRRWQRQAAQAGQLQPLLRHFLKVTDSYLPGLFHCYTVPDLPRTNNALEQLFGSTRHHERRCTGRKAASPSLVLRGSVRIVAGLGSRQHTYSALELAPASLAQWRRLRCGLDQRRHARTLRYRFRRDAPAFLRRLEAILLKSALPT